MILSKTCIYGIRAILYIAAQEESSYLPIGKAAKDLGISFHFLTKILQSLTQQQILTSYRGPKGGVALARPAEQIMLADIVSAIDGKDLFSACILGIPGCGEGIPCPLHDQWTSIRGQISDMFSKTSVATMALKVTRQGLRLSELNESDLLG